MKYKIFLFPFFGLIFFLLGFSNDLSVSPSVHSLAGKYYYKYDHCKDAKAKNKKNCACGWDYNDEDLEEMLTLKENGTFLIERISPQGGFEVLPIKGNWEVNAEGILILSGPQYYETEYLYSFEKIFYTFNGYLIEKNNRKKKSKTKPKPVVPWIKQN